MSELSPAGLKLILALAAVVALSSCVTKPPAPVPGIATKYSNACLPEAITMAQSLKDHGIQAKVLRIETSKFGHAVAAYLYPSGANQLWLWDSYWGSLRVRAYWTDAAGTARAWLYSTKHSTPLVRADWIE
jgi:hypothetical protein